MSRRVVEVTTGSRLHFGMLSFGSPELRQFGGVGGMIDAPGVRLRITSADELSVVGPAAELAMRHAEAVAQSQWFGRRPRCQIEVLSLPNPHVGLGSGTQLALAVVAGLNRLYDRERLSAETLARVVSRGRRSAVGLYGFLHGGLILEAGKLDEDEISPLLSRIAWPESWRFLLVQPPNAEGLSGEAERIAFERVPAVSPEMTAAMCAEALLNLLPAAATGEFDRFSQSLFSYGQLAGRCFDELQGGIYSSREATAIVETLRDLGIEGVGQSSWGPTVFAVLPDQQAAERARHALSQSRAGRAATCTIARPLNAPAQVVG